MADTPATVCDGHESSLPHIRPLTIQAIDTLCYSDSVFVELFAKILSSFHVYWAEYRWDYSRLENQAAYTLPEQKQN